MYLHGEVIPSAMVLRATTRMTDSTQITLGSIALGRRVEERCRSLLEQLILYASPVCPARSDNIVPSDALRRGWVFFRLIRKCCHAYFDIPEINF